MSRWADWFPVTPLEAARLRAASSKGGDAAVNALFQPGWSEYLERRTLRVEMDKAWEPIHRCLTGDHGAAGQLDWEAGDYPLKLCVLGGTHLLMEGDRTAALVAVRDVPVLAAALATVRKEWFRERFFALPNNQFHEITEAECEWAWTHFEALPPFFAGVAAAGNAVICTIAH